MGKYKRLAGDTLIFAIGSFGSKLILFLLVPYYTNCLTEEEYGTAELVYTAGNLIIPFVSLVVFDAVFRFTLDKSVKKENVILNAAIVFLIGSVVCIAGAPLIGLYPSLQEWKWYVSIYVISCMSAQITMTYVKAKERSKLYAALGVLQAAFLAGFSILFLTGFHLKIEGYLQANIVGHFLIAILAVIFGGIIGDLRKAKFDKKLFWQMAAFSSPLIINNVSWWVIQASDKFFVEHMIDSAALGLYTTAGKIPALINILTSIFSQAWGISSVKEYDTLKAKTFYSNVFRFFSFTVILSCACLLVIIKPFMRIYVGSAFFPSWKFVPGLLVAAVFSAISGFYGAIYGVLKKNISVMISTACSALINIVLNFLLIPLQGVLGAVIATVVAYVFIALYRMFDSRKYYSFHIDFGKLCIMGTALLFSAFCVTIEFFSIPISIMVVALIGLLNAKELKLFLHSWRSWLKNGAKRNEND